MGRTVHPAGIHGLEVRVGDEEGSQWAATQLETINQYPTNLFSTPNGERYAQGGDTSSIHPYKIVGSSLALFHLAKSCLLPFHLSIGIQLSNPCTNNLTETLPPLYVFYHV